ncbi:MAG: DUF4301 family protein [Salinivirgaceae bacterium]|nr:DUF4301 family protein [Salinivirgaceae bacterium]
MLTDKDLITIREKGITPEQIQQQIEQFRNGFPDLQIVKPATSKDGIKQLNEKQLDQMVKVYEKASRKLKRLKFVPASGAATRMFKHLYAIYNSYKGSEEDYLTIMADKSFNSLNYLNQNMSKFAFYNDFVLALEKNGTSLEEVSRTKDFGVLLETLLTEKGLNYGNLPKGLLKFHKTFSGNRTPIEEHFIEGLNYAVTGKKVYLHFTISAEHKDLFENHVNELIAKYEKENKAKFMVSFSFQKPSTDIVAVDLENNLFKNKKGELVYRPGGHGALIHNLNDLDADLIFIKNIDNVAQDRVKDKSSFYKMALAGILLKTKDEAAIYFKKLHKKVKQDVLNEIELFVKRKLCIKLPENFDAWSIDDKKTFLMRILDRPYRVCGMVKNEGEPGGGPYWVKNNDGSVSLQIVESSQFNAEQKELMKKSTHFNPVDIVCSTKNFKKQKYNLLEFIDKNTGFISQKSVEGNDVKALEMPGLWNGAMANWNTIFVEVPIETFNPVKSINDLLRSEHMLEKDMLANDSIPVIE